jgi:hypothetical protein
MAAGGKVLRPENFSLGQFLEIFRNAQVLDYLLFLKVFAYFSGTEIQKFLLHLKEIHNYNITLSLYEKIMH